jgi:hypothetical protein
MRDDRQMRLCGFVGLAAVTFVGTAAVTAAKPDATTLTGPIDKEGRVEVRISSGRVQGTPVRRYRWEFRRLSVRCSGEVKPARHPVIGGFAINADFDYEVGESWGVSGTREVGPDGSYETRVSGKRVSRHKARGWVRVFGTAVPIRGQATDRCDSQRLHWVARARR